MQAATRAVPLTTSGICVVLCQLSTPCPRSNADLFVSSKSNRPEFIWQAGAIERRGEIIDRILDFLRKGGVKPQIVVFPEYSVPFECHAVFQPFADENSCVLVPGSFYEPSSRNNVARVYIPHEEPLDIFKHDRFGEEERTLTNTPKAPNIAHLTWQPKGSPELSISIFLCRDYLQPFDSDRRSLLDWNRPGINLVLMLSAQTQLFEYEAGLAVRRLRGQGRFVGLCNCAGANSDSSVFTGTALLGPTKESRREHDIIERLPSDQEGILIAEVDLKKVEVTETKPSTQVHDPLVSVRRHLIVIDADGKPRLETSSSDRQADERGVWDPALLDYLERNITIVLRKSRHYSDVAQMLRRDPIKQKFHFVSSAGLLGEHDFMFRLYEDKGERLKLESIPYCSLAPNNQKDLFEGFEQKFVVEPKFIYKYRTQIVTRDPVLWEKKLEQFGRLLPNHDNWDRRRSRLSILCRLAKDWNDHDSEVIKQKDLLAPFFLKDPESVPRLGPNSGNTLRRRYMLVSLSNGSSQNIELFERHIIDDWLINREEVRSLYRVLTKSRSTPFHFWMDIVADPYEADRLLLDLQNRCSAENIGIGTRSIEVTEQLLQESIDGIENTDFGTEAIKFILEFKGIGLNYADILEHYAVLLKLAKAFHRDIAQDEHHRTRDRLTAFYRSFFAGNFSTATTDQREQYLREAANNWSNIFQDLESLSEQLLNQILEVMSASQRDQKLENLFGSKRGELWSKIRTDSVLLLVEYMTLYRPDLKLSGIEDLNSAKTQFRNYVSKFRNKMIHGGRGSLESLNLTQMTPDRRTEALDQAINATRGLVDLLSAVRAEVQLKKAAP